VSTTTVQRSVLTAVTEAKRKRPYSLNNSWLRYNARKTTHLPFATTSTMVQSPMQDSITSKLTAAFQPIHLEVINESHMHNVPKDSETHFKVIIVSSEFETTKSLLKRHRMINSTLTDELASGVHALSIVAKSPSQWEVMDEGKRIQPSPKCQGGDGSLPSRNG